MTVLTRDEYEDLMARFEETLPSRPGQPLIPYGYQHRICDFWRAESAQKRRIQMAVFYQPAATALAGPPWEDLA